MGRKAAPCLVFTALLAMAATSQAQSDGDSSSWAFSLEAYLLASSIEGDASIGRVVGVNVNVGFDDILANLDVGAMAHFEAIKNDRWGVVLDYGFMDLGGEVAVARNGVLEADVRQGVLEAFVLRRFDNGPNALDVYGGVRWWDNDLGARVDLLVLPGSPSFKVQEDWVDPVIGARWHHPMGDKWKLVLRADAGGFGVASDLTSVLGVSAFYDFESSLKLELGYRALWVDYEDGTRRTPGYFGYNTVTHGPLAGLVIEF